MLFHQYLAIQISQVIKGHPSRARNGSYSLCVQACNQIYHFFSALLIQEVRKRNGIRFRASLTRLLMTTSVSGPAELSIQATWVL